MKSKSTAIHVATTSRIYKGKTYQTHLLRNSYREDGKVKHNTLGNISHLPADLIEVIRQRLLSGQPFMLDSFSINRSLPHGHVAMLMEFISRIGLDRMISSKDCRQLNIILSLLILRIIKPASKSASFRCLQEQNATTSVGLELGLAGLKRDEVYQALDWLLSKQDSIEKKFARENLSQGTIVLYDLTGSYYTGTVSGLVQFGYNRDKKRGLPQIEFGLLCNAEGCPVAVRVFAGNTSDSKTVAEQVIKLRNDFNMERILLVGDRGMITGKLIEEQLSGMTGIDWITALRSEQIGKLRNEKVFQLSFFDQKDLAEVESEDFPGERLVVCRNPLLAEKRSKTRNDLLEATKEKLDKIVKATKREKKPLTGEKDIALKVGAVVGKHKVKKHFILDIQENSFTYQLDKENIAAESELDGIYIIRTSLPKNHSADYAVSTYKSLSKVEDAFRSLKQTRLQVRPIFHRNDDRIRAHIFLCMLSYYLEWHLQQELAPVLYREDDKKNADKKRSSVVAPAQKSDSAKKKAKIHKNAKGNQVHSLTTLLADLGTICKNEVVTSNNLSFFMITKPTAPQQQILDLLKIKL